MKNIYFFRYLFMTPPPRTGGLGAALDDFHPMMHFLLRGKCHHCFIQCLDGNDNATSGLVCYQMTHPPPARGWEMWNWHKTSAIVFPFKTNDIIAVENVTPHSEAAPHDWMREARPKIFFCCLTPTPESASNPVTVHAHVLPIDNINTRWHAHGPCLTYLCAYDFPVGTVASVAVFIPFDPIWDHVPVNWAGFSWHCDETKRIIKMWHGCNADLNDECYFEGRKYLLDSATHFCRSDTDIGSHQFHRRRSSRRSKGRTGIRWYLQQGKKIKGYFAK